MQVKTLDDVTSITNLYLIIGLKFVKDNNKLLF